MVGDRVHQLSAIKEVCRAFDRVYLWPKDWASEELFRFLPVEFCERLDNFYDIASGIHVFPLYFVPKNDQSWKEKPVKPGCEAIVSCEDFRTSAPNSCNASIHDHSPERDDFKPKGNERLWLALWSSVSRWMTSGQFPTGQTFNTDEPDLPHYVVPPELSAWALRFAKRFSDGRPILLISKDGGWIEKEGRNEEFGVWWKQFVTEARQQYQVFVPTEDRLVERVKLELSGPGHDEDGSVFVFPANLAKTAALASLENTRVVGVDGHPRALLTAWSLVSTGRFQQAPGLSKT